MLLLTVVHTQQTFGSDNHYNQDEGCGHGVIFVPRGSWKLVISDTRDRAINATG